jgi:F-type H+-transporting ATPase subunit gamma
MESAESLRRTIAITAELQSVVKTMKSLAGVNIRQCERAAQAVAEYNRTIEMGFQIALRHLPAHALPPRHARGNKLGAVIFGSDQGMCGQLNDQVVTHAVGVLGRLSRRRSDQLTMAAGARAGAELENANRRVECTVQVPSSVAGITAAVEEVLRKIEEWYMERAVEMVVLFNARPVSGAWYRIHGERLLPVDAQWINSLKVKPWPSKVIPTFSMGERELFRSLVREYLFVKLYRAFAESLASENASRLASMQVAERNVEDRLRSLTSQSRQLRQTAITAELLDIIASFESLRKQNHHHA